MNAELDKLSWDEVRRELVEDKNIKETIVDKIGFYMDKYNAISLIEK